MLILLPLRTRTGIFGDRDAAGARYRLIEHFAEGRTELVSALRGHVAPGGADPVGLGPRPTSCVPAGMSHRPVVPVRSAALMIEKAGVVATGD